MSNILIKDFKPGQKIQGYYLLKNVACKATKKGSKYLDIIIGDQSGNEINAKLWDVNENQIQAYQSGQVIKIIASVQTFKNQSQLIIEKIRLTNDEDDINIEEFIESAPIKGDDMFEEINNYINEMKNDQVKKLTKHIFNSKKEKLLYYPAAKTHHHAMRSGLLYHIFTMLKAGETLSNIYTFINKDLLYSGVILHDLAKVDEINSNEMGIVDDYTKEGKLLGHIIQGINEVDRISRQLGVDQEVALIIEHMILSHHYHAEYGSPKKPLIPEAELLHYLDILDSRMFAMNKTLMNTEVGQFAEMSRTLEGRSLYKFDF